MPEQAAWRFESITKPMVNLPTGHTIFTGRVLTCNGNEVIENGFVEIDGDPRHEPLRAYEPLSAATFEGPATTQYSEAFAKLEAGDTAAMPAFAALVGSHADDALAGFHLRRLLNGAKGVRLQLE